MITIVIEFLYALGMGAFVPYVTNCGTSIKVGPSGHAILEITGTCFAICKAQTIGKVFITDGTKDFVFDVDIDELWRLVRMHDCFLRQAEEDFRGEEDHPEYRKALNEFLGHKYAWMVATGTDDYQHDPRK